MLAIDCGNSRIKWARFDDGRASGHGAASLRDGDPWAQLRAALTRDIDRVLVANVAGADASRAIDSAVRSALPIAPEFVRVRPSASGIECGYDDPARLGVDRWLAMIAGRRLTQHPFAVVGVGTAVTFDAVDSAGRHVGGLIFAGDALMREALAEKTGGIGTVARDDGPVTGPAVLGRTTGEAVSRATWFALAAAVDRAFARVAQASDDVPTMLVTGGDAAALAAWLETRAEVRADLVLEGLAIVASETE
jgi:type III pantothenate kinase